MTTLVIIIQEVHRNDQFVYYVREAYEADVKETIGILKSQSREIHLKAIKKPKMAYGS